VYVKNLPVNVNAMKKQTIKEEELEDNTWR